MHATTLQPLSVLQMYARLVCLLVSVKQEHSSPASVFYAMEDTEAFTNGLYLKQTNQPHKTRTKQKNKLNAFLLQF